MILVDLGNQVGMEIEKKMVPEINAKKGRRHDGLWSAKWWFWGAWRVPTLCGADRNTLPSVPRQTDNIKRIC